MFNLNNVYTCLHLAEKTLILLVVEYKSGVPHFLHGQIEELKTDYGWKEKVEKLITNAERKLGLKFTKILVSIDDSLASEIKCKQVRLENFVFYSESELYQKSYEKLKKYFNQTFGQKYLYNDAHLIEASSIDGQIISLNNLEPGSYVNLVWKLLYCSCQAAEETIARLGQLGIDCLGVNLSSENFPALVENKDGLDKIIVYLGRTKSEIYVVHDRSIVDQKKLDYCTDDMITYVTNECNSRGIIFDQNNIYKILSQSILIYTQGIFGTKFFCEISDQFLSFNFVGTTDIYELCQKYLTRVINSLDHFVSDFKDTHKLKKVYVYFVFADEFYRHLLPRVVNQYQSHGITYYLLNFDLILSNDQRFIFPFAAIINLLLNQKMMNQYDYSINPYFSEDYEIVAAKKDKRLKIGKKVNALLQKLVK